MIHLKRLNNEAFTLNAVLIEQVQSLPDTTITLITGKKIVVKDKQSDVIQEITDYYQQIGLQHLQVKAGEEDE